MSRVSRWQLYNVFNEKYSFTCELPIQPQEVRVVFVSPLLRMHFFFEAPFCLTRSGGATSDDASSSSVIGASMGVLYDSSMPGQQEGRRLSGTARQQEDVGTISNTGW